jgi:hypothetical protein
MMSSKPYQNATRRSHWTHVLRLVAPYSKAPPSRFPSHLSLMTADSSSHRPGHEPSIAQKPIQYLAYNTLHSYPLHLAHLTPHKKRRHSKSSQKPLSGAISHISTIFQQPSPGNNSAMQIPIDSKTSFSSYHFYNQLSNHYHP